MDKDSHVHFQESILPSFFKVITKRDLSDFLDEENHYRRYGFHLLTDYALRKTKEILGFGQNIEPTLSADFPYGKSIIDKDEDKRSVENVFVELAKMQ